MASKKIVKKNKVESNSFSLQSLTNLFSQIKLGESYTSLFLGAVVVVVVLILGFSLLKSNTWKNILTPQTTSEQEQNGNGNEKGIYQVKEGDDLWTISEKFYGTGYNWVDIAKANNLENPDVVSTGTKLKLPEVKPVKIEESTLMQNNQGEKITGMTYTVVSGDYLWEIAIRAYGDGFKWVDIAKANNLLNPDLIFSGNVLKLPR